MALPHQIIEFLDCLPARRRVQMPIGLERRLHVLMPQTFAHQQDRRVQPDEERRVGVPLWHNKDKSENPCVATGWRFVLILFPPKTALKRGLREGVKNQGCT